MNEDQIKKWKKMRDAAREVENEQDRLVLLRKVYDDKDDMVMECIAHQSERVKHIMKDHNAMVESHKKYQEELLKRKIHEKSVNKVLTIIKYLLTFIFSSGIGAALMNFFKS